MSKGDGMPTVNYGADPSGTWKRGVQEAARREVDAACARCGHPKSCHGPNGCEVEVRDYGELDCSCTAYRSPRSAARLENHV